MGLVNCVLAAIHENQNEAYPQLPHSLSLYVNDVYRGRGGSVQEVPDGGAPAGVVYRGAGDPVPEAERTGIRTRAEVQISTPTVSLPQEGLPDPLWSRTRPPVMAALATGLEPTGSIGPVRPGGHGTRPTCWPRITVSVRLRAWLLDRPQPLPEFLDGTLRITAGVMRSDLTGVGTFLGLDLGSGVAVRFEPAAGTTLGDEQRALVEQILRNYLRSDAEPATFKLDVPAEVQRFDYKLEPTGPLPSAMLMVTLSPRPPGPKGPRSVSARFLPTGADFAVAVGRDYLLERLRSAVLPILAAAEPPRGSGTGYSYRATPDWASAAFDLQPGAIVFSVSGSGSVTYGGWFATVTDHWDFRVRVAVTLHVVEGRLEPALAGDPHVDLYDVAVFEETIRGKIRAAVRNGFAAALDPPPQELERALDVGDQLEGIIAALHPSPPGVALTGADIRPDGVVAPGTVALAPSHPVEVKRVSRGGVADAVESWVPGGTIERFIWEGHVEEHTFVNQGGHTPAASAVSPALRCLSVQGTRVTRGGGLTPVAADDCPVIVAALPAVPGRPTPPVPSRRPLLPLLAAASEGRTEVVGHYDPWASGLAPTGGPTNLLVHFAHPPWAEVASGLEQALSAKRERRGALVVVGVLEAGGLARAAPPTLDADVTLLLTDDPMGNWASAFGVEGTPATVLVGPDGKVRSKDEGPLDPRKLAKLLAKELEPGGEISWRALRLAVAASGDAPDAPLRLGDGRELALRRLRGGPVVLSFWTSCSEPSVEQLRQLREALESGRTDPPYVLGIGDGESPQQVAEVARRERLPFPLVPDPERIIARRYGVSSWPTTVQVGPDGRIAATDLGLVPGRSPCDLPPIVGVHSTA